MATLVTKSYAFNYATVKKESNRNFWIQTAFNGKLSLTTYGKLIKILTT